MTFLENCITRATIYKRSEHPAGKAIYFFLAFLYASTMCTSLTYAKPPKPDCNRSLKQAASQLQHTKAQYGACRSAKLNELETFNRKRSRYHKLMAWADQLQYGESLQPYIDDLAERDVLLNFKVEDFQACIPAAWEISIPSNTSIDNESCSKTLADAKNNLGSARNDLKACQTCGLATIGQGYNKSPLEILVAQQQDARRLREALYKQLLDNDAGELPAVNQWHITRDIFIAYITDTAIRLPRSQKLIVMLGQLEKFLEPIDEPDRDTDEVMTVYRQLAAVLQASGQQRNQHAIELWETFNKVVPDHRPAISNVQYTGFSNPQEVTYFIDSLSDQQRETLESTINTALSRYQALRLPS
jgi:hypothetical protein